MAPDSQIIAGPMGDEEGILYADIDLQECVKHKLHHDFSGHYNREDILQLYINRDARNSIMNTLVKVIQKKILYVQIQMMTRIVVNKKSMSMTINWIIVNGIK